MNRVAQYEMWAGGSALAGGERSSTAVTATTKQAKSHGQQVRRWDPFDMLNELEADMARFRQEPGLPAPRVLGRFPRRRERPGSVWRPSVDIYEKDGHLVVKAESPGVKKEDISVTLDHGDLEISGERQAESEVKEEHVNRLERSYGSFSRRLPLPEEVQPEQIEAGFKDGVLDVRLPKPREQPKADKIALK